jgi:hypothetical protein
MLLIFSARVILNYGVAPDALFRDSLNTTFMVVVAVIHNYIGSVGCAVYAHDTVADVIALYF